MSPASAPDAVTVAVAVTDAAVAILLEDGQPHKGGVLCPECGEWSHANLDRRTHRDHARVCLPLRLLAHLSTCRPTEP